MSRQILVIPTGLKPSILLSIVIPTGAKRSERSGGTWCFYARAEAATTRCPHP